MITCYNKQGEQRDFDPGKPVPKGWYNDPGKAQRRAGTGAFHAAEVPAAEVPAAEVPAAEVPAKVDAKESAKVQRAQDGIDVINRAALDPAPAPDKKSGKRP